VLYEVLLSSYNGGELLRIQLESILSEPIDNLLITVRDDGSSCPITLSILDEFASRKNVNVLLGINIGVCDSFHELLKKSRGDLCFFCDQDDFWLADKIPTIIGVWKLEDNRLPLLIANDLEVVDRRLEPMAGPFFSQFSHEPSTLNHVLISRYINFIPGCSMTLNRCAVDAIIKIKNHPKDMLHDWFAYYVCARIGKIIIVDQCLQYYRQHENNVLGYKYKFLNNTLSKYLTFSFYELWYSHRFLIEDELCLERPGYHRDSYDSRVLDILTSRINIAVRIKITIFSAIFTLIGKPFGLKKIRG
jgi:rhamnosyltransferase